MHRRVGWLASTVLVGLGAMLGSCGSNELSSTAQGGERQPCYPNQTCNAGLSCLSDICVLASGGGPSVGGAGGSAASGGGTSLGGSLGTGAQADAGGSGGIGTAAAPGSGGGAGVGSGGAPGSGGSGGSAGPSPEICDGLDNDMNGIIDDVDAGGDGVCDCLKVATLGFPGGWGITSMFTNWLPAMGAAAATSLGDQVLTSVDLTQFQVVVSLSVIITGVPLGKAPPVHAYSVAEQSALETWVRSGGGFMTTTGMTKSSSENINVNQLLAFAGMIYDVTSPTNTYSVNGQISDWTLHATTAGVALTATQNGWAPSGSGTIVARDASYGTALLVNTIDNGRIAAWGDDWITYEAAWIATYDTERLWKNLFKWLPPPDRCQVPLPP